MDKNSVQQCVLETQDEKEIVCILCEGSHGNNTLCQMSWRD